MSEAEAFLQGAVPDSAEPTPPATIAEVRRRGRPSTYTPEIAAKIVERIAESNDSLRRICQDDEFPSRATVNRWLAQHEDFGREYAIAAYSRLDDIAMECLEIIDELATDEELGVNRAKARVEERHYILGKLAPRRYGDNPLSIIEDTASPPPAALAQGNGDNAKVIEGEVINHPLAEPMRRLLKTVSST